MALLRMPRVDALVQLKVATRILPTLQRHLSGPCFFALLAASLADCPGAQYDDIRVRALY